MNAMIEGAFQFARFFEEIHQKGKVYCSISPDVFYFNLKNGAFHFEGEEFLGEAYVQEPDAAEIEFTEFLAPELAESLAEEQEKLLSETEEQETLETFKECYSLETDRYFMAVYLFEYFFHTGSPFEGKKMVNRCFLSPEEKELFRAREGRFCMEPGEEENIPVKGIQDKLIQYWNEYPEILQKMYGDGLQVLSLWFSRIFLSIASEGKWNICLSKVWKDLLPTDQWNGQDSSCRRRKTLRMPDRKKSDG